MLAACNSPGKKTTHPGCRRLAILASLIILSSVLSRAGRAEASPGSAEMPYHNGSTLLCSDCHDLALSAAGHAAGAQTRAHLKTDDLNALCLSCHDGIRGVPDVMGPDINGLTERSAGWFQPEGAGNPRGHSLDLDHTCVTCHDPHGNGQPRNLRLQSEQDSETRLGLFTREGVTGIARYERENVAYGTLDSPALREVSALCLDCHSGLGGQKTQRTGEHGGFLLHPSYDSREDAPNQIAQGGADYTTNPIYWDQGTGPEFLRLGRVPFVTTGAEDFTAAAAVEAGRNGVFCLSCHKAHGSEHPFALRWGQAGSDGVTGCNECHAKGRMNSSDQLTQVVPAGS
jgi:predicted CXXCH cytochrome family protein